MFSGQSIGPELLCEHMFHMLNYWLFRLLSQSQTSMQKYTVFSQDGMRTNAKIFLNQIEFLFSYQLITCIRCLMSVCYLKNRYNTGKYVWHKPDGLIFVFMEIVKKKNKKKIKNTCSEQRGCGEHSVSGWGKASLVLINYQTLQF